MQTREKALEGSKSIAEEMKKESGTKGFTVADDKEASCVRTMVVYESWEAAESVHKGKEANIERGGTSGQGAVRVRAVDGFLGREERGKL